MVDGRAWLLAADLAAIISSWTDRPDFEVKGGEHMVRHTVYCCSTTPSWALQFDDIFSLLIAFGDDIRGQIAGPTAAIEMSILQVQQY